MAPQRAKNPTDNGANPSGPFAALAPRLSLVTHPQASLSFRWKSFRGEEGGLGGKSGSQQMQREKMGYKQFRRRHNAVRSDVGRGRETGVGYERRAVGENGRMTRAGRKMKERHFGDEQCERWLLD